MEQVGDYGQFVMGDEEKLKRSSAALGPIGWEISMTPPPVFLTRSDVTFTTTPGSSSGQAVETRIVDPSTGGEKGSKLQRYDLIPPEALEALSEVYGRGALKYADRNWEKGYAWGLSYAALMRHLEAWRKGQSVDPETGAYHLMQVAWHAIALFTFELRNLGTDDLRLK